MKQIDFHPLANEYPLMPARELGRLEQGMIQWGFDPRFPIVLYQKKILDGRNRYLAAQAAGVKPVYSTFTGSEEDARQFVQKANEERRHLAPEWLERRRAERVARVAEARQQGQSLRTIAATEGVSKSQVERDLQEAGPVVPGGTTETVTGTDGKQYQSSKPAPTPPESKLIPELRCRPWSPRFLPLVEVLDVATQYAFNARLNEGKTPAVALAEVTEQIKQPEPPAPKPTPKPAKAEREPGDDTEAERADELYIAERILASCAEDEQAGDCTLTKHQAGLITAELARLRKNQRKGPAPKFTPPTLEEVKAYCLQMGYTWDAEEFFDYQVSSNWLVGKKPMVDWKAAVRTWNRNQGKFGTKNGTNGKRKPRRGEYVEEE